MTASSDVAAPGTVTDSETPVADGTTPPDVAGPADGTAEVPPKGRRRKLVLLLLLLLAFILLLALAIWYLLFRQPISVLPGIPGETVMPTYVTSVMGAQRPLGVAVSADGSRIYVGETEGDRVARLFDAGGKQIAVMRPPLSTGEEHVPVYLAVDPLNGEVYVSDRPTGSVYIYDSNGTYQRAYTPPGAVKGWQPLALTFDAAGNLYATDVSTTPQTILEFDRQGNLVRTIGDKANLSFPNGVAVDAKGYVYVTDSNNGRLVVFDTAGLQVAQIGRGVGDGNLGLPRGIAVSSDNRVYVADATGQGVYVYSTYKEGDRRLDYLGFFGGEGLGNGQFEFPNGLALDGRGRIYVVDSANDRVQVWSY
jgi:DNA-binding beta-propeller fold protein YncE